MQEAWKLVSGGQREDLFLDFLSIELFAGCEDIPSLRS